MSANIGHRLWLPLPKALDRFEKLTPEYHFDALLDVEFSAYSHPDARGNFTDALTSGYECQLLMAGDHLLVICGDAGVDEAHLLNITVAPPTSARGWHLLLQDAGTLGTRTRGAVVAGSARQQPARAQQVYEAHSASAAWGETKRLPCRAWGEPRRCRGHEPPL